MNMLTLEGVEIEGLAAYVPANEVRNDAKVAQATGIVTRRIVPAGTTVVDLCVKAAEKVLADTGAAPSDFGAILCVSFTQRDRMPAAAIQAQARLGFPKDIIAFDVSLACSGWVYGLYLAGLLVRQTGKKVLLLDGDVQSDRATDENVRCLLGDAGTATVIGVRDQGSGIRDLGSGIRDQVSGIRDRGSGIGDREWRFSFFADGEKGAALKMADGGAIEMDGFGVFRFVATDVVAATRDFLSDLKPQTSNLSFVPHQPNVYMVRQLAKSVGIDEVRTMVSCDTLGNLSSASIPVTLVRRQVRGKALLAGFGGGLSISLALVDLDCRLSLA